MAPSPHRPRLAIQASMWWGLIGPLTRRRRLTPPTMDPYAYLYGPPPPTAAYGDAATDDLYEPPLDTTTVVLHYDGGGGGGDGGGGGGGGAGTALEDRLFTFPTVLGDAALTQTLTTLVREHWQPALSATVDVFRVSPSARLHHETITLRFTDTPNAPTTDAPTP